MRLQRKCPFRVLVSSFLVSFCTPTFDINPHQMQMVADHLSLNKCRKLSESLHDDAFVRSHDPNGKTEATNVSCLSLLEHWNTHDGQQQSFQLLALRLRQLGKDEIADKLAKSVYEEKISQVRESFLSDPFKERINKDSPLLEESPHSASPDSGFGSEMKSDWTAFEIIEVVGLVMFAVGILFVCSLLSVKIFLPDSFARMRASFYHSLTGRRPFETSDYFLL